MITPASEEVEEAIARLHDFWPNGWDNGDVAGLCEDMASLLRRLTAELSTLRAQAGQKE